MGYKYSYTWPVITLNPQEETDGDTGVCWGPGLSYLVLTDAELMPKKKRIQTHMKPHEALVACLCSEEAASAGKAAACHFGLFCDGWWEAFFYM